MLVSKHQNSHAQNIFFGNDISSEIVALLLPIAQVIGVIVIYFIQNTAQIFDEPSVILRKTLRPFLRLLRPSAMPRPMPSLPPVTSAVLPSSPRFMAYLPAGKFVCVRTMLGRFYAAGKHAVSLSACGLRHAQVPRFPSPHAKRGGEGLGVGGAYLNESSDATRSLVRSQVAAPANAAQVAAAGHA
jgi:hypothetical protein